MDLIPAIRLLPQQLDIVTLAIDGHITCHSQRLEDSAFIAGDGEGVGTLDLTHDGDLVVLDEGIDDTVGIVIEVGPDKAVNSPVGLLDGQAD